MKLPCCVFWLTGAFRHSKPCYLVDYFRLECFSGLCNCKVGTLSERMTSSIVTPCIVNTSCHFTVLCTVSFKDTPFLHSLHSSPFSSVVEKNLMQRHREQIPYWSYLQIMLRLSCNVYPYSPVSI